MICKGIDDRAKGISRQLLYLVEPLGQFRPGYIFNTLSIEYICQFHGKPVRLLQFWIEFKNNIGSPPLRRCPLGFMFREYKFGTGQKLLAGITVGMSERYVPDVFLTTFPHLFVLQVAHHPAQ